MMKDVRVPQEEYRKIEEGKQLALFLRNDNFALGEAVTLREMAPGGLKDTGRVMVRRITDVKTAKGNESQMSPFYVILSLAREEKPE